MDGPLFGTGRVRPSAPSTLLKQNAMAAKTSRNLSLREAKLQHDRRKSTDSLTKMNSQSVPSKKNFSLKRAAAPRRRSSSSNLEFVDDDIVSSPSPSNKKMKPTDKDIHVHVLRSSSDEDEKQTMGVKKPTKTLISKYFNGMGKPLSQHYKDPIEIHSDQEDCRAAGNFENTPEAAKQIKKLRKLKHKGSVVAGPIKNGTMGKIRSMNLNDSSDSELEEAIKRSKLDQFGNQAAQKLPNAYAGADEDEVKLLKKVMKESKKTAAKEIQKRALNDEEESVQTILDESSEEDNDPDEDYSQQKEAAMTVLKATELLSGQVVTAMNSWISQKGEDKDDEGAGSGNKILQGIIVDGAISLGNLDAMASDSGDVENHVWISNDTMKKACPNVTLSNYQLIGVNWLALLHGMKCNVGKKDTNVNGVLADEMGLVRAALLQFDVGFCNLKSIVNFDRCFVVGENRSDDCVPGMVEISAVAGWHRP